MAKKNNRTCKVCASEYYFCPNCAGVKVTEKYRTMFCSKNCRDIFHLLSRHTMNDVTKDEAKEILSSLDLSKLNNFSEQIKIDIDEIMGNNKKHFKKKIVEEPIVEEQVVEPIVEPAVPVEF